MNPNRSLLRIIGLSSVLMVLAACARGPEATAPPTATDAPVTVATHAPSPTDLPKTRRVGVDMNDLVVDVSCFPQGWYSWVGPYQIPDSEKGEEESVYVEFHHEEVATDVVGAGQRVFRYANERNSGAAFPELVQHYFLSWYMATPWAPPEDWTYQSGVADRFEFACGEVALLRRYWRCQAVAQYDEYISVLFAELHPEYMTLGDVERLVAAVDARMALHLGEDSD